MGRWYRSACSWFGRTPLIPVSDSKVARKQVEGLLGWNSDAVITAIVNHEQLRREAFRLSEELRRAIARSDKDEAVGVFVAAGQSFENGDLLAVNAILIGELVDFLGKFGLGPLVSDLSPSTQSLFDDLNLYGRSEELFSEVMQQLLALGADGVAEVVPSLINVALLADLIPTESQVSYWTDFWWGSIYSQLAGVDIEQAVAATVRFDKSEAEHYMSRLTVYTERYLAVLAGHEIGFSTLTAVEPEATGMVAAYSDYEGNARFLALRLEIDRIGSDSLVDMLLAMASAVATLDSPGRGSEVSQGGSEGVTAEQLSVFRAQQFERLLEAVGEQDGPAMLELFKPDPRLSERQHARLEAFLVSELIAVVCEVGLDELVTDYRPTLHSFVHAYRRGDDGGAYRTSVRQQLEMLTAESKGSIINTLIAAICLDDEDEEELDDDTGHSEEDDAEPKTVEFRDGSSMSWSDDRNCWVDSDGEEWLIDQRVPHIRVKRAMWEALNPGEVPRYVAPQPPPPERPDRRLAQESAPQDARERERVLSLSDKAQKKDWGKRGRFYEKSTKLQLAHYQRTGRWLLGVPPEEGWYRDPLQKYKLRYWQGWHWTEHVSNGESSDPVVDPDFPTDEDCE